MGFDTYFLIVWDLCRHANEEGIWYNARGSAAGSIVAFSLGITLVDPIEHGLIFERFLNPGRVSMPDIDLDFQDDLRYKMLEYTADRYGRDKVAQIITFGTLGARASLRDVGRVLDIPLPEVDRAAKLIPNIPGKPVSIPEALETVTAFNELYQSTPYLREMVDIAAQLEGVARNAGTHAAGVIITPDPIIEYIPLHRPTKSSIEDNPIGAVTQFEMQVLDDLGLLKVDFLGLSTLTVMERACRLIRERHGVKLDIHSIPLDDPDTYQLLGRGAVQGVFQVEGAGMRRNLMEMKPQKLTHVIAMVALYRPGPMKFIPDFIRRMHGEEKVSYRHPKLEPILEETYGITVYQEQIMYTAMNLGGYSASEADDLRKAVAKKKAKQLRKHRDKFVQGAVENGISEDTAKTIFKDWEAFARYGFPKGHAADYAVICVQTAYLKAHYPIEYMTALMSVFKHDTDKVALYIADCRRMGFEVLPPDVNESGNDFEIEERSGASPSIRFGLSAVKNVGEGAADIVIQARQEGGSFTNLQDFARRVDLRHVGKRALESLIQVGAFDCLGPRNALLESMDRIISLSTAYFKAAEVGQMSFFGAETGVADHLELPPPTISIPRRQRLDWERELLGVYVSDHPLTPYLESLTRVVTHFSAELPDTNHQQAVCVAGEICNIRPYQTRNGNPMGFVTLEDLQGTIDLVIFTRVWRKVSGLLEEGKIVIAKGKVDRERGDPKILVDELTTDLSELEVAPGESSRDDSAPFITSPPESETVVIDSLPPAPTLQEDPDDYFQAEQAEISAEDLEDEGAPEEHSEAGDSETLPGKPAQPRAQIHKGGWTPDPQDHPRSRRDETPETFPDSAGSQTGGSPSPKGYGHERALQEPVEPREESPELVELPRLSQGDFYMVKIILHSTGDKKRDALRMRRVHGLLTSYPGNDRFTFQVYEASRRYNLEFPNDTTGYCSELHAQLLKLLGEGSVQTEIQRLQ
jgi:DNA polymerase-3 subunit alpha